MGVSWRKSIKTGLEEGCEWARAKYCGEQVSKSKQLLLLQREFMRIPFDKTR